MKTKLLSFLFVLLSISFVQAEEPLPVSTFMGQAQFEGMRISPNNKLALLQTSNF